jgi:hypothetical protein
LLGIAPELLYILRLADIIRLPTVVVRNPANGKVGKEPLRLPTTKNIPTINTKTPEKKRTELVIESSSYTIITSPDLG